MTIRQDHQQTTRVTRVTVSGDTEAERNAEEDRRRAQGYRRALWETFEGGGWRCTFVRSEEVEK